MVFRSFGGGRLGQTFRGGHSLLRITKPIFKADFTHSTLSSSSSAFWIELDICENTTQIEKTVSYSRFVLKYLPNAKDERHEILFPTIMKFIRFG